MIIKMTNAEIYDFTSAIIENKITEEKFPIKVNFFLQKNIKKINELALEIEEARMNIINKYGTPLDEDPTRFKIADENIEAANRDLKALFEIEQEVDISPISLSDFGDINLSFKQVESISFMIKEG